MKDFDTIVALRGWARPTYLELHRSLGLGGKGSILLAGPSGGEGVSTVATELALFLSARGQRRTLLVDAHRADPALTRILGAEGRPGLAEVLDGSGAPSEFVRPLREPSLSFLPSGGTRGDDRVPLLDRDTVAARLGRLREAFEFVVFDAPPVSATSDSLILASCCDAFVLVIEAERTRREAAESAVARLREAGVPLAGAFLNKQRFRIPETIYRRI